ncbi:MAG: sarcosine oxidase, partial [Actinobacteria bacterium]|nr:sarcosine oxidase [Actinomycetota bacterium]
MSSHRLPPQPGEAIDRSTAINFTWNGQPVTGFAGDTIASALAAQGVDVFSRSMKYHRHRGIMTADHWDPNLSLQVGDEPNVRAGTRLLEEGMQVSTQNVWPSLKHDVGVLNKVVGRFLSAGFYYKTFMKPKFLWDNVYQSVLRKFAPGGRVHWKTSTHGAYDKRYAHPDVLVAGGGP